MNRKIWQELMPLESHDLVKKRFEKIHNLELSSYRVNEICASAKQAKEYFTNTSTSDYSVRPLLAFYGVASLSRALILLLRPRSGEASLKQGHGLETVNWNNTLSGEVSKGLESFENLTIKTSKGIFRELIKQTNNQISIHVHSSAVDWRLNYNIPETGEEITFHDLLSRLPDLQENYNLLSKSNNYVPVQEASYNETDGFSLKVISSVSDDLAEYYRSIGYQVITEDNFVTFSCNPSNFESNLPLFTHTYLNKTFGSIPGLYLSTPFNKKSNYSQLSITYMVSYTLGMLVRYYPTHWNKLVQGGKGDELWPTINQAQYYIEHAFPELVAEMIDDIMENGWNAE